MKNKSIIFMMILITLMTIAFSVTNILNSAKDATSIINKESTNSISNKINNIITLLESISQMDTIKDKSKSIIEKASYLKPFQDEYDFFMLAVIDENGNASNSLKGGFYDLSDREYFIECKNTKKSVVSDVIISRTTGEKNIVIIHPMIEKDEFTGAVFISIKLSEIIKFREPHSSKDNEYSTIILNDEFITIDSKCNNYEAFKNEKIYGDTSNVFFKIKNNKLYFLSLREEPYSNWNILTTLNVSDFYFGEFVSITLFAIINIVLFVKILSDFKVNKQKEIKPLIEKLNQDYLTGISNRLYLESVVKRYLEKNNNSSKVAAFIILDIDNFKNINDLLGHHMGDTVIRDTSVKIQSIFKDCGVVSRFGGDEFVVFIEDITSESMIINQIKEVLKTMECSYLNANQEVKISSSIGITLIYNASYSYLDLYNKSDTALYNAKNSGKNCGFLYNKNESILIKYKD